MTNGLNRIVDNAHLLDATEIFRKLSVHKKVRDSYSNLRGGGLITVVQEWGLTYV